MRIPMVMGRLRGAYVAAAALFAAIAVALHAPGLMLGPTADSAVFTEVAFGLREGLLPYRDLWDHKPPGAYAAFAFAQAALPGMDPWLGPWLLGVTACTLLAVLTFVLLLPVGARFALIGGTVVAVYVSVYPIALGGGQTEPLATVAILAAFALAGRPTVTLRAAAASGALVALGAMTSLLVFPAAFAVGILLVGPREPTTDWRSAARRLATFALAGLMVLAFPVVVAAATETLPSAWSALVTYNGAYATINRERGDLAIAMGWASILLLAPLVVCCAIGSLGWIRSRQIVPAVVAGVTWIGLSSIAIAVSGRLEPHYLIVVIPPLALLAVPAARGALNGSPRGRVAATAFISLAVLVAVPVAIVLGARTSTFTDQSQVRTVASWLRAQAAEPGTLFVWGDEPELYYTSGLMPVTPYVYVTPLLTPGYGSSELSEHVAQQLAAAPPEFVVDAGSVGPGEPGTVPLLVPRPVISDGRSLDTIDPIRQFVRERYGSAVEVAGWLVYTRLATADQP